MRLQPLLLFIHKPEMVVVPAWSAPHKLLDMRQSDSVLLLVAVWGFLFHIKSERDELAWGQIP